MSKRIIIIVLSGLVLIFLVIILFCSGNNNDRKVNANLHIFQKVTDSMNFPEGPAWDGVGAVYVSSCYGKWITKISDDSTSIFLSNANDSNSMKQTNGLTVDMKGDIFACDFGRGVILKIQPDGKSTVYASGYNGKQFNRPNDLAFDSNGNLYFTDPKSHDKNNPDGVVYRIDANSKNVELVASCIAFPNGIAFSSDSKYLYVCESSKNRILKYPVKPDGFLDSCSVFIDLPGGEPDGIAFDVEGNLYVAHFGGGAIYVITKGGIIKDKISTPGKKPSNLEFCDLDLRTMYITEDETNAVYRIKMGIPGLRLFSHR